MTVPPSSLAEALSDRYRLERELGAGGMATVYLAQDMKHQRPVAVKVLREDLTASLGKERFLREITIAAGLTHPHIVPLHDSGEAGGRLFYVMPYVEGLSLRQKLIRSGELPIADAVRILRDVADAMTHAHKRGVVHRDLKPENVMLAERHALVTDFGVAKALSVATGRQTLTTAGIALGTPAYMSPEQATADPNADHRSDLYAFGVIAYELLTGRTPFQGGSPQEVLAAHVTTAAIPVTQHRSSIPPGLATLVMRCLEKKPADRPQTAEELIPVLEAVLTPSGGITPHATAPYETVVRQPALGSRGITMAAAALAVVLVAGYGAYRFMDARALPPTAARAPVTVIPFAVLGSDKTLTELADQVAAKAITYLEANGIGPVVRATGSRRADGPRAILGIARSTGANTIITGEVSNRGDDVEIIARVVRAYDGAVIWTLGPERASRTNASVASDSIMERIAAAVTGYVSPGMYESSTNASIYSPPRSLAAFRLFAKGQELFTNGSNAESIPLFREAYAADTTWLGPVFMLQPAFFNLGMGRERDSVLAFLEARRPRLSRGFALWLDHAQAVLKSPEAEYRAMTPFVAADSGSWAYIAMWTSVRTGRPGQALLFHAQRDTTGTWGRDWQAWDFQAGLAYHQLGRFEEELALARAAKLRSERTYGHWAREVRALAALGRSAEVDSVIVLSSRLENPGAPVLLVGQAMAEFRNHGWREAASAFATRSLAGIDGWSESLKSTPAARNIRRDAYLILARYDDLQRLDIADARQRPAAALVARINAAFPRAMNGDTAGVLALADSAGRLPLDAFGGNWPILGSARYNAAILFASLGKRDETVAMLREALNNGARFGADERLLFYWDRLRGYPPFEELVRLREP